MIFDTRFGHIGEFVQFPRLSNGDNHRTCLRWLLSIPAKELESCLAKIGCYVILENLDCIIRKRSLLINKGPGGRECWRFHLQLSDLTEDPDSLSLLGASTELLVPNCQSPNQHILAQRKRSSAFCFFVALWDRK